MKVLEEFIAQRSNNPVETDHFPVPAFPQSLAKQRERHNWFVWLVSSELMVRKCLLKEFDYSKRCQGMRGKTLGLEKSAISYNGMVADRRSTESKTISVNN